MKSILYITHISWGWIKQRPQFLAEELCHEYKIDVLYRKSNHQKTNLNPSFTKDNLKVAGFRNLPLERISFIPIKFSYIVNKLLWDLKNIKLNNYDYIWITDPLLWELISHGKKINNAKIIYDCMDDYSSFPYMEKYPFHKSQLQEKEADLIKEADFLFCSASTLANKLNHKYNLNANWNIVNNAITSDIVNYNYSKKDTHPRSHRKISYIGTVSEWIDFDNIIKILETNDKWEADMYGPIRMNDVPSHDRLNFKGTISHDSIMEIMMNSDALMMPFVVNELIESVNPVKLYEYIYSGKPILASRYNETLKFSDFVYLYKSYEDFNSFIQNVENGQCVLDSASMQKFALENTWKARALQITDILKDYETL